MNERFVTCGGTLVLAGLGAYVAGPLGMAVVGVLVAAVGLGTESGTGSGDSSGRRNCPDCGAVVEGDACNHCGRSLSE